MQKVFTLFYKISGIFGGAITRPVEVFIHRGLNDDYTPSNQTLKNILDVADAYHKTAQAPTKNNDRVLN